MDQTTPPPATRPSPVRRIALVLIAVLVIGVGAFVVLHKKPAAPEALPTAEGPATEDVTTLPLPSASELASSYGGLSANTTQQSLVTRVGNHIAAGSDAAKLAGGIRFFVLADENRINVFAMPDGTIFITTLMLNHLKTEAQLAGMLAHEIAQVTSKHKPVYKATGEVVFSRDDEIRADAGAVRYMSQAGYNPQALIGDLMMMRDINTQVPVEFFVTHPSPVNRIARIDYAIKLQFPNGVPDSLSK